MRVAVKLTESQDKTRKWNLFVRITKCILYLSSSIEVIAYFEVRCRVRSVGKVSESFPSICNTNDAVLIDDCYDWTAAKHLAQWWTRAL